MFFSRQRFIEGEHDVTFPVGTYRLRILSDMSFGLTLFI